MAARNGSIAAVLNAKIVGELADVTTFPPWAHRASGLWLSAAILAQASVIAHQETIL